MKTPRKDEWSFPSVENGKVVKVKVVCLEEDFSADSGGNE